MDRAFFSILQTVPTGDAERRRGWHRRWLWRTVLLLMVLVAVAPALVVELAARVSAYPDDGVRSPSPSTVVLDRTGQVLASYTADDGRWYLPTIDHGRWLPLAVEAVEDARFRSHAGVDWFAAYAAIGQNLMAGRVVRGSSTITMQVERLRHARPRTLVAKVVEAVRARQIERTQDKDAILAEWLERASFGGNVVGAGAASWRWFGVPPASLSLAQAALIAGLPQNPERLRPDRHPEQARERRDHVLRRLQAVGAIGAEQLAQALSEPVVLASRPLTSVDGIGAVPVLADLAKRRSGVLGTTLDLATQRSAAALAGERLERLAGSGIDAAAVAVLDVQNGDWLALVSLGGQQWIDHTAVARSSGSALKPFIYAGAFARGIATPSSLLADDPAAWRGWTPANFDRTWRGRCSAAEALRDSRNLPAMHLLEALGVARAAGIMEAFGLERLASQSARSGLTLAIGGAEVDARGLATAYAGLARDGRCVLPRLLAGPSAPSTPSPDGAEILPPTACRQVLACLNDRERTRVQCPTAVALEPAWKTGTSSGQRDAWCVALTPRRCVVVWFGVTRGPGSPALVGAELAAPVALAVLAACDPGGATWPPVDMGSATAVATNVVSAPLVITSPTAGSEILRIDGSTKQRLALTCGGGGSGQRWWFIDGAPLACVAAGEPAWWTPTAGRHALRVVDQQGQAAHVEVLVR